ncbi:MAG TPA: sigma-54 dependent transcriptional regulator [Polyangiaceae bacterium]
MERSSVLLVDEGRLISPRVESELGRHFRLLRVEALGSLAVEDFDVLLLPYALAAKFPKNRSDRAPRIVAVAPRPQIADLVRAMHAGVHDIVWDADDVSALRRAIVDAAQHRRLLLELARLQRGVPVPDLLPSLLGESAAMVALRERVARVAASEITTLITGPSGSGKDLVARAIHEASARQTGPLVGVSCSAIPRNLLESEFFGHARGAFTGAASDRAGHLVQASGGTLFLDEVADLPLELQAKLLRVLQERSVRPLGKRNEVDFNVRIVAATSRDLEEEVSAGRFREDLFFRLNVIHIRTPALRDRELDALLLAQHFIARYTTPAHPVSGLTPAAAQALLAYSWPGNVRELEHCIAAAINAASADHIGEANLPLQVRRAPLGASTPTLEPLDAVERKHIVETLRSVDGNKAMAARILDLDRKTLFRKLQTYEKSEQKAVPARPPPDSIPPG